MLALVVYHTIRCKQLNSNWVQLLRRVVVDNWVSSEYVEMLISRADTDGSPVCCPL